MQHDRPNENYNREKKYPLNYTFFRLLFIVYEFQSLYRTTLGISIVQYQCPFHFSDCYSTWICALFVRFMYFPAHLMPLQCGYGYSCCWWLRNCCSEYLELSMLAMQRFYRIIGTSYLKYRPQAVSFMPCVLPVNCTLNCRYCLETQSIRICVYL